MFAAAPYGFCQACSRLHGHGRKLQIFQFQNREKSLSRCASNNSDQNCARRRLVYQIYEMGQGHTGWINKTYVIRELRILGSRSDQVL